MTKSKLLEKFLEWMVYIRNKTWSPFFANLEKWRYSSLFKQGAKIRAILKIHTVKQLVEYLHAYDFQWENDPLYGAYDYESYPEITLATRRGDCDDFARLGIDLLKHSYQKVWKVYCYNGSIYEGHVMVLFYNKNGWKLLSNTNAYDLGKNLDNPGQTAAECFFGDQLFVYAVEKIKDFE